MVDVDGAVQRHGVPAAAGDPSGAVDEAELINRPRGPERATAAPAPDAPGD